MTATLCALPNSEMFTLGSHATGTEFRIAVSFPWSYGMTEGSYPVLYTLDANLQFGIVSEMARLRSAARECGEVIVVGIGQALDAGVMEVGINRVYQFSTRRWDLDASRFGQEIRAIPAIPGVPATIGGLEATLAFLVDELQPMIAARYRVDPDDRALLGHSAAGHFVLQALFRRPEGFTRYAAISPALAYNDGEAFELEAQYARTHTDLPVSLYLGVGSEEARALAYVNVVSNTARMIEQLDVRNYPGLKLSTGFLSGKTHISVFPEALNQVLERFWPA